MSANTKQDPLIPLFSAIVKGIAGLFKSTFKGLKTVFTKIPFFVVFLVFLTISIYVFQPEIKEKFLTIESILGAEFPLFMRYILYFAVLLLPLWYLLIIGGSDEKEAKKYYKMFADIGFKGKDGKYPHFLGKTKDGHKDIYTFKSNISKVEWEKKLEPLQTALDCSIRRIEQDEKSKKKIRLITVSNDFQIPKMIRWNDTYIDKKDGEIVLGQSDLNTVSFNLNSTPHVLAAGETGSGKSVVLRCMLWQMISKGCRIYMIDFKGGVEFGKAYEKYGEVITERERALAVLEMLVEENAVRLKLFRDLEVKNLKEYNDKTNSNLCRIGVFCDEIAEMLDKKGVAKEEKEIFEKLEGALSTLARLSRATGINLFLGVQRPDANVLTGQIKNNVPVRICGRFADKPASEIVLGNTMACTLPEIRGRFIYKMGNESIVFQSFYFDDKKDLHEIDIVQGDLLTEKKRMKKPLKMRLNQEKYNISDGENSAENISPAADEDDYTDFENDNLPFDNNYKDDEKSGVKEFVF